MKIERPALKFRIARACCGVFGLVSMVVRTLAAGNLVPEYTSHLWQMEDGLPHTIVQAIVQTHDGYLWVGTREGLARFDGLHFTPFNFPGEIAHPSINSLCEGPDGSLWIATQNAGLFRWHAETLSHYGRSEGLKGDAIVVVEPMRDGSICIGTHAGVAVLKDGKIEFIKELETSVGFIRVDANGTLWTACYSGLKSFQSGKVADYTTTNGLLGGAIKSVYRNRSGVVWIGGSLGLTRMQDGICQRYPRGTGPSAIVNAVFEDREGNVWVGTYAGMNLFRDGEFIDQGGGTSYKVYAIIQDLEGNVWIGSEEGLRRLAPRRFTTYTRQQGLTHDKIASVCEGGDGSIWIGTWGGGVNRMKDGRVTVYARTNGLASDYVYSVHEGRDGRVWIGLDGFDGLDVLEDGRFTHYGRDQGLVDDAVTVVQDDQQGNVWIGTRGALYRMRGKELFRYDSKDGLTHPKISALRESRDGSLWIGTAQGLTRWSGGKFAAVTANGKPYTDPVISLYEDAPGALWVGTQGQGLKRFVGSRVDVFTTKEGLLSDVIYAIEEDDRTNLWMSSSKGIFEVAKREFDEVATGKISSVRSVGYDRMDGIVSSSQSTEITQPASCRGKDGRLWFRTMQGVIVTDPNRIAKNLQPPPLVIEDVLVDKKRMAIRAARAGDGKTDSTEAAPISSSLFSPLVIGPGRGELEIRYTGLSFQAPEKNRFKYKLEGVDTDWVDAGAQRFAYYNHLGPGKYTFRVIACNNDVVWNEKGATLVLTLQPHFWQTAWFLTVCGIALVGFIAGSARYATEKKLRRQMEILERQHAIDQERSRIARDMHDDLGSTLANIVLMGDQLEREGESVGELKQQGRRIKGKVQQAIQVMDQIVWAVSPEHDSLTDLASYFSDYAQAFLEPTSSRCRLEVAADLPEIPLTAHTRHDLFLAVKEALNNAARHARATEIWLRIQHTGNALRIKVEDNGRGFSPGKADANRGNGLRNMRARLASMGGVAEILSDGDRGTTVQFILPLAERPKPDRLAAN